MLQLAPAARLDPQLFPNTNEEAFVPVTAMLEMVKVVLPVFVMVTVFEALAVPTSWLPNDKLVGDSVTGDALTPVPVSAIDCGDPLALSVMVTAAVSAPAAAGAKWP